MIGINSLVSLSSLSINARQNKKISSLEGKLSYIQDDISWIESTELDKLLSNQADLRSKYEKDLAELFLDKQQSLELEAAINNLVTSGYLNDPNISNIMLGFIDNINFLLTSTSDTLIRMFNLDEMTLDKMLNLINEINSLKLKFNLNNADLQLKISDNSKLIIKLSEQQLAHQLSTLQRFQDLRDDLEVINAQVDKKITDLGVLATNTTGVILGNGSFKLADSLTLVNTEVFDISFSEVAYDSASTYGGVSESIKSEHVLYIPTFIYNTSYLDSMRESFGNVRTSCSKLNLLSSTLIKKFTREEHSGVGLLLSRPYKLLVSGIDPQRDLFLFLRGAGLSNFDGSRISIDFVPALIKWNPITRNAGAGTHALGSEQLKNVTWGEPGSYKIPSSVNNVNISSIFTSTVIQKSDELIVIKVRLSNNYASTIPANQLAGGVVSGSAFPTKVVFGNGNITGGYFRFPDLASVLAAGSIIINLPVSHLSFTGVECAQ